MDIRRWQRVNELFAAAIARPCNERPAFVATACAGDEELQTQIDRLLRAHERSHGLLEAPAAPRALRILALSSGSLAEPPLTSVRAGSSFAGTERFVIVRHLGAGGMGMVYEVLDRARNETVALKTLLRARPGDIFRLKREFRSLADIAHPNLVSLYELVVDGSDCFFTMELVRGVNLVEYVRQPSVLGTSMDYERVRRVFRQLVEGIIALHGAGKLHRDIKPSNILVTSSERVVILDFGLASDVAHGASAPGESLAGTLPYLAPERHARATPSESQDWYSVGVTLYEALAGSVPFDGWRDDVLRGRSMDPPRPGQLTSDVRDNLASICAGLLQRDPAHRLSGRKALEILDGGSAVRTGRPALQKEFEVVFVGRRPQLSALDAALEQAKSGAARTVYVHGPSGIGKSALVEHFLAGLPRREDITVLRGRCYERESVPYKALDGVIDSLSEQLIAWPKSQVAALFPPDLGPLLRVFPVMMRVSTRASSRLHDEDAADPVLLRRRAFEALRELLIRMSAQRPLVIFIDDLHWADADSAALLETLLRRLQARMLTIACVRTEEVQSKPFLQALLDRTGEDASISLALEPMSDDESQALLRSAMGTVAQASETQFTRFAREAGGTPLLLHHLADYVLTHREGGRQVSFAETVDDRLSNAPSGAKRFLETLSICGRAMAPEVVYEAAGLVGDERPLVGQLRAARFLRASGSAQRVEMYHDRIRETLVANVSLTDTRRLHGSLARTLVSRGVDDPENLYEHYREAGEHHDAAVQAAKAAAKADAALAFDRAAAYYRAALELAVSPDARPDWKERLAAALAHAGRPAEAADAYLEAAVEAVSPRNVELKRMAAGELLSGGHIDSGLEVIRTVLRSAGLRLARSPTTALASMLCRRMQLRWRGVKFVERDADDVPGAELLKIDTCWSVATGLAMVDYVHAVDFQTRHLLLALEAGDSYRVARGFAAEVFYFATRGTRSRESASAALARAEAMAARAGHPHPVALCVLARSAMAFLSGDWPAAHLHSDRAFTMLRNQPVTTTWELNTAQIFRLGALLFQGELRAGARELAKLMAAAKDRGNLYLETELRTRMNLLWLAADQPDQGIEAASDAMRHWSHAGFHRQHYNYMLDQIQTELYCGRARSAWEVIASNWTTMTRTHLLRMQFARIEATYLRGRCALLMAARGESRVKFLRIVRADTRTLARENSVWASSLACLLSAGVHFLESNPENAAAKLAEAATGFERAQMKLYAAVARRRLGELARDDEAQEHRRQSDDWMTGQGIVNPGAIARLIAPGFPDEGCTL